MARRSIYDLTSPEVNELVGRTGVVVMPFGSVEQHGPHLPCGTDTMAANLVATELAEILDALVVPAGQYGVTPIHAGHPGTISLRRDVFESYLTNLCEEMVDMGASTFVFVNWHEGNIASLDAVATDLQVDNEVLVVTAHACYTAQRIYAPIGGELTHGGGIETLAVMAHDPELAQVDRARRADQAARSRRARRHAAFARGLRLHNRCHRDRGRWLVRQPGLGRRGKSC